MKLSLEEQETHLNMAANDRTKWHVFSDDPVMQRRLEKTGAVLVSTNTFGGKEYTLHSDQVLLRKGKRRSKPLTEEQKRKMREGLSASTTTGSSSTRKSE